MRLYDRGCKLGYTLLRAEADILIAACGHAEYVTGDWIKPGAAVIDVGINAVPDASKKSGHRLVGDVHYQQVCACFCAWRCIGDDDLP